MASAARMVLKPSSHSSITGRRRCSHSNVAGGWTLLRTLGAPLPSHAPGSHRLRWRGPDICDRHVWAQIFRIGELRSCSVRL